MKIMLTGGTGFIGSYVVERLLAEGHQLTLLARDPGKVPGQADRDGIRFVRGSITDREAVRAALHGAEACIHLARGRGTTGVEAINADTLPAVELFQDAYAAGVEQIVYTSSIAVFDDRGDDQFTDQTAQRPITVYGATKAAAEAFLVATAVGKQTRVNAVRPGYTFGNPVVEGAPTQAMPELPRIAGCAARGEPIHVVKNAGLQFIWAGDLARVYSAILGSSANREYYTSLSPEFHTWEELAGWAVEMEDSSSEIVVEDTGRGPRDAPWSVAAIEKDFGLRFNADDRLKDHLRYWAERTRSGELVE